MELAGHLMISSRRLQVSGWMVVGYDNRNSAMLDRRLSLADLEAVQAAPLAPIR